MNPKSDQPTCVKCGDSEGTYPSGTCRSPRCHCKCEFPNPKSDVEAPERVFLGPWVEDELEFTVRRSPDEIEYIRADLCSPAPSGRDVRAILEPIRERRANDYQSGDQGKWMSLQVLEDLDFLLQIIQVNQSQELSSQSAECLAAEADGQS